MEINGRRLRKIRWVLVASGWMNHHIENVAFSRPSGVFGTPRQVIIRKNRNFTELYIQHKKLYPASLTFQTGKIFFGNRLVTKYPFYQRISIIFYPTPIINKYYFFLPPPIFFLLIFNYLKIIKIDYLLLGPPAVYLRYKRTGPFEDSPHMLLKKSIASLKNPSCDNGTGGQRSLVCTFPPVGRPVGREN